MEATEAAQQAAEVAGDEEVGIMDFGVAMEAKKGSVRIAVEVGFSVTELTNPDSYSFRSSGFHPFFLSPF